MQPVWLTRGLTCRRAPRIARRRGPPNFLPHALRPLELLLRSVSASHEDALALPHRVRRARAGPPPGARLARGRPPAPGGRARASAGRLRAPGGCQHALARRQRAPAAWFAARDVVGREFHRARPSHPLACAACARDSECSGLVSVLPALTFVRAARSVSAPSSLICPSAARRAASECAAGGRHCRPLGRSSRLIVTLKCGPGLRIIQFRLGTAPGEAAPVPPSCTSLQCIPPSPIEPVEARAAARAPPPQLLPLLSQWCAKSEQLRNGAPRHAALTGGGSEGLRKAAPTAGLRPGRSRPRSGEQGGGTRLS